MSKQTWVHWVVAAILVVVAGALIASAEERIEVRVEKNSSDEISVDVNGVTEVVRLDDLADGESRTFDVGDHELVVKRIGDDLTIVSDGHGFGTLGGLGTNVWVTDEGEKIEIDGDCEFGAGKVIVVASGDQEAGQAKTYTIHVDGDEVVVDGDRTIDIDEIVKLHGGGGHGAIFISKDGDVQQPAMGLHGMRGDMEKYRCEETGSVLMVKKGDAIEDVYICPATGCVMTKVEEPEMRVIKIEKRIEVEDEE
jgi:nitrite reductase/ring-hydroxylating ferredoxin subunit